ncbi:hypothetical protein ACUXG4_006223 [Cupriavidus metallidurans]
MQLAFFPHNTKVEFDPAAAALIVLVCISSFRDAESVGI